MSKQFPIQQCGTIPWECAQKAYETYSKLFGTAQSLEQLAQRAGFGVYEFCSLYLGLNPLTSYTMDYKYTLVARVAIELCEKWQITPTR